MKFDVVVVGSGVSGLICAIELKKMGVDVLLITKGRIFDSNSFHAQGGVAVVFDKSDSFDKHFSDTVRAGRGLCDESVVKFFVENGPGYIRKLIYEYGIEFERMNSTADREGGFLLGLEGGHSHRRVLHSGDATGQVIIKKLYEVFRSLNVKYIEDATLVDVITTKKLGADYNRACGVYVFKDGKVDAYEAGCIVVATGGAGKLFLYTTNPPTATGDGVVACYRAGCRIFDMEFYQFHPTCLYSHKLKNFLISEALRGEGAILKTRSGERFMPKYDEKAELAPRDVVARAIDIEIKKTASEFVYLDISFKEPDFIKSRFPTIYRTLLEAGIDMTKEPIPIVPAAHYMIGGVYATTSGRTDVEGLYAIGEVASTGFHGANRLASNSLLEAIIMGFECANEVVKEKVYKFDKKVKIPLWQPGNARDIDEEILIHQNWDEIRRFMWNYVGVTRSNRKLERALRRIEILNEEIKQYYWDFILTKDLIELRNIGVVAMLVIKSAILRHESRGAHYNKDFPYENPEFKKRNFLVYGDT